jgi:endonuclease/exonuclease/phosphatase family metal-dependent hydrolase
MSIIIRFLVVFFLIVGIHVRNGLASTDTITVMVYNLLYYGINTSFCTSANNNVDQKDINLRTIISHTKPDIFAVNELGRGEHNADRILNEVLNYNSDMSNVNTPEYRKATYTNTRNSSIVNMLYYRDDLFGVHYETVISSEVRDINMYTLYYKDERMIQGDTTFLTCIVAHLKAGSSNTDQQTRLTEIQGAMAYISQNGLRGNLLFMGDFNMKSSYEQAYGLLTYHPNEEIRFYDPIDKPGVWTDNPDMSPYHTQSTRKHNVGCFVSGGMDDRFDHVLVSGAVLEGTLGVQYVSDSYRTLGQDGKRLNESLIDPSNYSEPEGIIQALYNTSDHLPVLLDLSMGDKATYASEPLISPVLKLVNPVSNDLVFSLLAGEGDYTIRVLSVYGTTVFTGQSLVHTSNQTFTYDVSFMPSGLYILQIISGDELIATARLFKY